MNVIAKYSLFLLALLSSCSKSDMAEGSIKEMVEVSIGGSSTFTTRTSLGGDDLDESQWEPGDEIAVWAKCSDGSFSLLGEKFVMRYYNSTYSSADFAATILSMDEGEYTYYGVYPYPTSYSNTTATFSLSATQSGEYDGVNDIMVAKPIVANELTTTTLGADPLSFSHLMHILRFEIPDGRNDFGMDLTGLEVTFSQSVVGDVTVDITNPNSATTLSNGNSTVYISFDEPFETGDGRYIWLFIHPTTLSGDVTFVAKGEDGNSSQPKVTTSISGTFAAGAITPIKLSLPEPSTVTTLQVEVPRADVKSNIGETLQSITFTSPSGLMFEDKYSTITIDELGESDVYSFYLYDLTAAELATLNSSSLGITFETKSVKKTLSGISISGAKLGEVNSLGVVTIPPLVDPGLDDIEDDGSAGTGSSDTTSSISDLSGWYGANCSKWDTGWMMLRSYVFAMIGISGVYESRITTCPLSTWGVKSGVSVDLLIEYKVTWTYNDMDMVSVETGTTIYTGRNKDFIDSQIVDLTKSGTTYSASVTCSGAVSTYRIAWNTISSTSVSWAAIGYDEVLITDLKITIIEEE